MMTSRSKCRPLKRSSTLSIPGHPLPRQLPYPQLCRARGVCTRAHKITLDGYQASHRAAREVLAQHGGGARTKIRSSKYLNNLIEQDHRPIKLRLGPMLGLKRFRNASITIAGVELMHRIRKGQFKLGTLRIKERRAPEIWNAVLDA